MPAHFQLCFFQKKKLAFFSDVETQQDIRDMAVKFFSGSDLLIVEGFKDLNTPKIGLFRKDVSSEMEPRYKNDPNLILICGDSFIENLKVPQIDINYAENIADFIEETIINT